LVLRIRNGEVHQRYQHLQIHVIIIINDAMDGGNRVLEIVEKGGDEGRKYANCEWQLKAGVVQTELASIWPVSGYVIESPKMGMFLN